MRIKATITPMVQIFGTAKSPDTLKALRFFKERGTKPQFVDLQRRAMAPGEIARFVQKFGLSALVNTGSKAYGRAGLAYLRLSDEALMQRLLDEPQLMVQPLLRLGTILTIGWDEAVWRDWHEQQRRVG